MTKPNKTRLAALLSAALIGGGLSGAQPLLLADHAHLVHNLRAARKGNRVQLAWTQPLEITDRRSIVNRLVIARVCRGISSVISSASNSARACAQSVGKIALHKSAGAVTNAMYEKNDGEVTMRFTDVLPENLETSDLPQFAVYTVELRDDHGRRAGTSNQAWVLLAPQLAVKGLHSELDARGVYLIWEDEIESRPVSLQFDYQLYRREKTSSRKVAIPYLQAVVHTRDGNRWTAVDTTVEWEKTYFYWIRPVTRVNTATGQLAGEFEGEDSASIVVTTHDVFPPAVPQGLLALVSQDPGRRFVDLVWAPNGEKDLAGYNVYRSEQGAPMARINPALIKMLSFQDNGVMAGHKYLYSVSAVDLRGNESPRSPESSMVQP